MSKRKYNSKLTQFQLAYDIARNAHAGRMDKSGFPEFLHPFLVMKMCKTDKQRCIALLHDVVEETRDTANPITLDYLLAAGIDEDIVKAVANMTREKGEGVGHYLDRVASDEDSCEVKRLDMIENMSSRRNVRLPEEERRRKRRKYEPRLKKLLAKRETLQIERE